MPLHIFEPRYKELIGECLDRDREFGLVFADEDGVRGVGTLAGVVEVLNRYPEGELDIVVEGHERFRTAELTEGRPFSTARVETFGDDGPQPSPVEVDNCMAAFRKMAQATGAEEVDEPGVVNLSFEIAARVGFEPEVKQELLEMRSERDRVLRLGALLEVAADLIERQREVRRVAAGNGHAAGPSD